MFMSLMARRARALRHAVFVPALLLTLAACGKDEKNPVAPIVGGQAPDFSLVDQNPNSATSAQPVSPRQKLNKISAWYFGHAT